MSRNKKYDAAVEAINAVFKDKTPDTQTIENLKSLKEEIDMLIDSLK